MIFHWMIYQSNNEAWIKNEWWMNEGWIINERRMENEGYVNWRLNEEWMKDEWRMNKEWMKDEWRLNKGWIKNKSSITSFDICSLFGKPGENIKICQIQFILYKLQCCCLCIAENLFFGKGIESSTQLWFSNPYIFATQCGRP